jgi:hypothetical protein
LACWSFTRSGTCRRRHCLVEVDVGHLVSTGRRTAPCSERELRNLANATLEREAKMLDEVLRGATDAALLVVP